MRGRKAGWGVDEDLVYGRKLLPYFAGFLQALFAEGLSKKTFVQYRDSLYSLGGTISGRCPSTRSISLIHWRNPASRALMTASCRIITTGCPRANYAPLSACAAGLNAMYRSRQVDERLVLFVENTDNWY
jgi:hypothetical protein